MIIKSSTRWGVHSSSSTSCTHSAFSSQCGKPPRITRKAQFSSENVFASRGPNRDQRGRRQIPTTFHSFDFEDFHSLYAATQKVALFSRRCATYYEPQPCQDATRAERCITAITLFARVSSCTNLRNKSSNDSDTAPATERMMEPSKRKRWTELPSAFEMIQLSARTSAFISEGTASSSSRHASRQPGDENDEGRHGKMDPKCDPNPDPDPIVAASSPPDMLASDEQRANSPVRLQVVFNRCSKITHDDSASLQGTTAITAVAGFEQSNTPDLTTSGRELEDGRTIVCSDESLKMPSVLGNVTVIEEERVPRPVGHRIDFSILQTWRRDCLSHGSCCNDRYSESLSKHLTQLLLVDVTKGCLVTKSSSTTYIALSYVWGKVSMLKTTSTNINELRREGALFEHRAEGRLADTVRDAMHLVKSLGEKYLWVDCLCIVQDCSAQHMAKMLQAMGHIFASAELTIAAVNGPDANHGLRGVGGPSRDRDLDFASLEDPVDNQGYSSTSHWAQRGWTFQESLFSRRILVFDTVVSWLCGRLVQHECVEDVVPAIVKFP